MVRITIDEFILYGLFVVAFLFIVGSIIHFSPVIYSITNYFWEILFEIIEQILELLE